MNQRIKKIWLEALRSGEYKKGVGCLRANDNTFCCLGVLCDLYAKEHPSQVIWSTPDINGHKEFRIGIYSVEKGILPKDVARWAELKFRSPSIKPTTADNGTLNLYLTSLNDNCTTFDKVIKVIEEQL